MSRWTHLTLLVLGSLAAVPLHAACGGASPPGSPPGRGSGSDDDSKTTFQMQFTDLEESEQGSTPHVRVHGPWQVDDAVIAETTRDVPFVMADDWRGYRDRDAIAAAIKELGPPRAVIIDGFGNELLEVRGEHASDRRFLRAVRQLDALIAKAVARTEQSVAQAQRKLERGRDREAALEVLRRAAALEGYDFAAEAAGLLEHYGADAVAVNED